MRGRGRVRVAFLLPDHPSLYIYNTPTSTCPAHNSTPPPSLITARRNPGKLFRVREEMASAGAYQPGASLAEAYVMRKLYKEKMKKEKMAEDAVAGAAAGDREEERTTTGGGRGCLSLSRVFGKKAHVHPSSAEAPHVAPSE
ncbi:hypothetical protein NL676_024507 [Syzygium grande]|nr:hypothetical protein NL676_024507 [Syzygium grande]